MFTYSLMTRSLRVDHENLSVRDAELCAAAASAFARAHGESDESRPAHQVGARASRFGRVLREWHSWPTMPSFLTVVARVPKVLELDLGAPIGSAESTVEVAPVVCVEIDADVALGDESTDHRKHVLGSRAQVIVLVTSLRVDQKERGRVIARAVDVVRRDWSVATVAVHPGAPTSYLDTLLLAGRADLGVL